MLKKEQLELIDNFKGKEIKNIRYEDDVFHIYFTNDSSIAITSDYSSDNSWLNVQLAVIRREIINL